MFNFDPKNRKSQEAVSAAVRGDASMRSVQSLMPLADIEGPFLRLKDGATCVYMTYPGANLSLSTEEQRVSYAIRNGQVLAALRCDVAGIFLIPEPVSAESNLLLADRAIERLTASLRAKGAGNAEDERALEILERHIRPDYARQAADPGNVAWRAYLGMRFDHGSDHEIKIAADATARAIRDCTGKEPRLLEGHEILDLIDLYFRGARPASRVIGTNVVMPKMG